VSLQTRLEALVAAIGADVKQLAADIAAAGGGSNPWTDEARSTAYTNSTVTASDVFTGFTPVANARYIVDVLASVHTAAATTGIQTALAGPTSGITRSAVKIQSASAAATDLLTHTVLNTFQAAAAGLTTPTLLYIQSIIEVGASPGAGKIRMQAKSEVAGSLVTVNPGSSMRWRTI
jgi:hypothetical protein